MLEWLRARPWAARILKVAMRFAALTILLNEVRGLILAAPVLYGMFAYGNTAMQIWVGICILGGIALSVIVPAWAYRKAEKKLSSVLVS